MLFAVGMSWGGLKKDRDWVLVKYNNFAKLFMIFILLSCISITYDAFTDDKEIKNFVLIILCGITILSLLGVNEVYHSKAWFDENNIMFNRHMGGK
ncbi:MAG: hypothetical protein GY705_21180 [Bacteroidetes bacterium]|nr:hypothetical protein [Bacteroidota bacterium]